MGVKVSVSQMDEVIKTIADWLRTKKAGGVKKYVVTAYSETILEYQENFRFKKAVNGADMVVADGVSVVSAIEYVAKPKSGAFVFGWVYDLLRGAGMGVGILSGVNSARVVSGVELMRQLVRKAAEKGWKIMLVGGWEGSAEATAEIIKNQVPSIKINTLAGPQNIDVSGKQEMSQLIRQINEYAPDLLFVAFGRFRQEIWINENIDKLNVGVAIGVGSAFDEIGGKWSVPGWVNKMGLKWLWRVGKEPGHLTRAVRASMVFPWELFKWYRRS